MMENRNCIYYLVSNLHLTLYCKGFQRPLLLHSLMQQRLAPSPDNHYPTMNTDQV